MRPTLPVLAALMLAAPAHAQTDQTKMILEMTRANWVAVRDWDGQDLLYFTHLESYRCGIASVDYSVNGGKLERWDLAACPAEGTLVAPIEADYLPYTTLPQGSVEKVTVQITFPDGSRVMGAFDRAEIETP